MDVMTEFRDILGRVTIQDILDSQGIQYRGRRCRCPIHCGNNPTAFSFTDEVFNCFVCGSGGGKLDLIMALYKASRFESMQILARIKGESLSTHCNPPLQQETVFHRTSYVEGNRRWLGGDLKTISFVQEILTRILAQTRRDTGRGKISAVGGITNAQLLEYQLECFDELYIDKKSQLRCLEVRE